ncbi:hypothetical protein JCM10207_002227 [Rhodosporidiobolus poonsookiae]
MPPPPLASAPSFPSPSSSPLDTPCPSGAPAATDAQESPPLPPQDVTELFRFAKAAPPAALGVKGGQGAAGGGAGEKDEQPGDKRPSKSVYRPVHPPTRQPPPLRAPEDDEFNDDDLDVIDGIVLAQNKPAPAPRKTLDFDPLADFRLPPPKNAASPPRGAFPARRPAAFVGRPAHPPPRQPQPLVGKAPSHDHPFAKPPATLAAPGGFQRQDRPRIPPGPPPGLQPNPANAKKRARSSEVGGGGAKGGPSGERPPLPSAVGPSGRASRTSTAEEGGAQGIGKRRKRNSDAVSLEEMIGGLTSWSAEKQQKDDEIRRLRTQLADKAKAADRLAADKTKLKEEMSARVKAALEKTTTAYNDLVKTNSNITARLQSLEVEMGSSASAEQLRKDVLDVKKLFSDKLCDEYGELLLERNEEAKIEILQTLQKEVEKRQDVIIYLRAELDRKTGEVAEARERLQHLDDRSSVLDRKVATLHDDISAAHAATLGDKRALADRLDGALLAGAEREEAHNAALAAAYEKAQTEREEAARKATQNLEETVDECRRKVDEAAGEAREMKSRLGEATDEAERRGREVEEVKGRLEKESEVLASAREKLVATAVELGVAKEECEALKKRIRTLDAAQQDALATVAALQRDLDTRTQELKAEHEKMKQESRFKDEAREACEDAKRALREKGKDCQVLEQRLADLEPREQDARATITTLNAEVQQHRRELSETRTELSETRAEVGKARTSVAQAEGLASQLVSEKNKLERDLRQQLADAGLRYDGATQRSEKLAKEKEEALALARRNAEQLDSSLATLQSSQSSSTELKSKNEILKERNAKLQNELDEARATLSVLQQPHSPSPDAAAIAQAQELARRAHRIEELSADMTRLTAEKDAAAAAKTELEKSLHTLSDTQRRTIDERAHLTDLNTRYERDLAAVQADLAKQVEAVQRLEGELGAARTAAVEAEGRIEEIKKTALEEKQREVRKAIEQSREQSARDMMQKSNELKRANNKLEETNKKLVKVQNELAKAKGAPVLNQHIATSSDSGRTLVNGVDSPKPKTAAKTQLNGSKDDPAAAPTAHAAGENGAPSSDLTVVEEDDPVEDVRQKSGGGKGKTKAVKFAGVATATTDAPEKPKRRPGAPTVSKSSTTSSTGGKKAAAGTGGAGRGTKKRSAGATFADERDGEDDDGEEDEEEDEIAFTPQLRKPAVKSTYKKRR